MKEKLIKKFKKGDVVKIKNKNLYMDNGDGTVFSVNEQKVPGSNNSIIGSDGKTYYYTSNS